jgi:hypothetical protein
MTKSISLAILLMFSCTVPALNLRAAGEEPAKGTPPQAETAAPSETASPAESAVPAKPAPPAKRAKKTGQAPPPHLGYLYPAGGQQGATVTLFAGGQYLNGVKHVHVSGTGIQGRVVHAYQPLRNLDADQRRELARQIREAWDTRLAALPEAERAGVSLSRALPFNIRSAKVAPEGVTEVKLPDHPLFNNIAGKDLWELSHLVRELQRYRKRQQNAQLGSLVEIELTIDADAAPGGREIRLGRGNGLSNPMRFQVGVLQEANEQEPNNPQEKLKLPARPAIMLPITLNGQITPGDVDRFRFQGRQGQQLTAAVSARGLNPYLADAVPGWFQAVVSLYDAKGKELAYADDYYFNPDPVLFCTLPEDGEYELEIRDAIYRGREDFVYRVSLGELPFITRVFPAGGQRGSEVNAEIAGYNLPVLSLPLDLNGEGPDIRRTRLAGADTVSNEILYAAGDLPEILEAEPNNGVEAAQPVALPITINGVINEAGDEDVFVFEGHANEVVVAEVMARRLGSPLDALVRLTDAGGNLIGWNDDSKDKLSEMHTHHADALLTATLPSEGLYRVHVLDTQGKGGADWVYRLKLAPPKQDFSLLVAPATLNMRAGGKAELTVHAVRRGGFDGDIEVVLADMPPGFVLSGGLVPAGQESVQVTLSAPGRLRPVPIPLHVAGRAVLDGTAVERRALPVEDMMQAFLPRHLVPVEEALVLVSGAAPKPGRARPAAKKPRKAKAEGETP